MSRFHGSDARVFLSTREVSSNFAQIDGKFGIDLHPVDVFGTNAHNFDPGLYDWEATLDGFYSAGATEIGPQLETMGSSVGLSVWENNGSTYGDKGWIGVGILESQTKPIKVNDMVHVQATVKGTGRAGLYAKLHQPYGSLVASGVTGTVIDQGSSSTSGGRSLWHIISCTGTWNYRIQHSVDSTTWVDYLASGNLTASTWLSQESTAPVQRYTQALVNYVAGSTSDRVFFSGGFARY